MSFEKCRHNGPRTIVVGTVAVGFIAYLIYHWGEEEGSIYSGYYNKCLNGFIETEGKKAGAWRRDLRKEFSSNHFNNESKMISLSQGLYEFVPPELARTIRGYVDEYVKYIKFIDMPTNGEIVPDLKTMLKGEPDQQENAILYIRTNIIKQQRGRGVGKQMAEATKYLKDKDLLYQGFNIKAFHKSFCQEFDVIIGYEAFLAAYKKIDPFYISIV